MMKECRFKATRLIADYFEEKGLEYDIIDGLDYQSVTTIYFIGIIPVVVNFISKDDNNDVFMRAFGFIINTPEERRSRVLETCKICDRRFRFLKFNLDEDGDVFASYDFPPEIPDEVVGKIALEMLIRTQDILPVAHKYFVKALTTDEELNDYSALNVVE